MAKRRKFQGVLNILSFNRHFYVYGIIALVLLIVSRYWFDWYLILFNIVVIGFIYGLTMPLIVSAYVYDYSGYYDFHWLNKLVSNKESIQSIVSINAGFDETSFIIKEQFPYSQLNVFDFYNPQYHTEAAIIRARKVSDHYPNTQSISSNHIPLPDQSIDVVFLLSAVHEIRSFDEKVIFLSECKRICHPEGKIIMVEHLRDFPNFVAFTIGFTHFFSRHTWKKAFEKAECKAFQEIKFTPFLSIFTSTP
jgi:SAM-dependent methyltransferase